MGKISLNAGTASFGWIGEDEVFVYYYAQENTDFKNEAQQQIVWIIQIIFSVAAGLNPPLRRKYTKKAISTFDN